MIFDLDDGNQLIAPMTNHKSINEELLCNNLISLIKNQKFNFQELLDLSENNDIDQLGLNIFDLFVLKCYLEFKNPNKIIEIGCGTSTRLMNNLGYNVETFALDDIHSIVTNSNPIKYHKTNLLTDNGLDEVIKNCNDTDLLFVDGLHSYNFAKRVYEDIVPVINTPVICHDFLPLTYDLTWGEQYYLMNEFLNKKNNYSLFTTTSINNNFYNRIKDETGIDLTLHEVGSSQRVIKCLGIIN